MEWNFHPAILSKETIFWTNTTKPVLDLGRPQLLLEALLCLTSALPPSLLLQHRPRAVMELGPGDEQSVCRR